MASTSSTLIPTEQDVVAAGRGSHEAFGRLVEGTQSMVTGIALAIVGDPAASHDIAQETYLAVWNKLSSLADPSSFLPWLRAITRNRSRNYLTSRTRQTRHVRGPAELEAVRDTSPAPAEQLAAQEERELLQQVLADLPDESREVLILYYREGRSTSQVASLLDLSETAVRQRLSRARKRLRAEWEGRVGRLVDETRPDGNFTMAVLGMVTTSSPTLTKAIVAKAAVDTGAKWFTWKTVSLYFTATVVPAVVAVASVVAGMRAELRRAASDEERRGLARIRNWAVALVVSASVGFTVGAATGSLPITFATYVLLCTGMAVLYLHMLPQVISQREAEERERDPANAARHRRQHRIRWMSFIAGAAMGGVGLAIGLWGIG